MHVMQKIDNKERSDTHATAKREQEASSSHLVRTHAWPPLYVAPMDVREWLQYHDKSKIVAMPFLIAVMVRRRTFFQEDLSILFLIMPPNNVEVEPCFVMATLISRTQTSKHHEEW